MDEKELREVLRRWYLWRQILILLTNNILPIENFLVFLVFELHIGLLLFDLFLFNDFLLRLSAATFSLCGFAFRLCFLFLFLLFGFLGLLEVKLEELLLSQGLFWELSSDCKEWFG